MYFFWSYCMFIALSYFYSWYICHNQMLTSHNKWNDFIGLQMSLTDKYILSVSTMEFLRYYFIPWQQHSKFLRLTLRELHDCFSFFAEIGQEAQAQASGRHGFRETVWIGCPKGRWPARRRAGNTKRESGTRYRSRWKPSLRHQNV